MTATEAYALTHCPLCLRDKLVVSQSTHNTWLVACFYVGQGCTFVERGSGVLREKAEKVSPRDRKLAELERRIEQMREQYE